MAKQFINPYRLFVGSFIPNWLLQRVEVSQGAKLAYARLCQYAGEKGVAFPKRETIAAEIGVSQSQFDRYVKELVELELIETDQLGMGHANRYRFLNHPWIQGRRRETGSAYMRSQESAYMRTPLKRFREENHADADEEAKKRIDYATSTYKRTRRTNEGLRAAVAQRFGRGNGLS